MRTLKLTGLVTAVTTKPVWDSDMETPRLVTLITLQVPALDEADQLSLGSAKHNRDSVRADIQFIQLELPLSGQPEPGGISGLTITAGGQSVTLTRDSLPVIEAAIARAQPPGVDPATGEITEPEADYPAAQTRYGYHKGQEVRVLGNGFSGELGIVQDFTGQAEAGLVGVRLDGGIGALKYFQPDELARA